jgi:hypothetical protein
MQPNSRRFLYASCKDKNSFRFRQPISKAFALHSRAICTFPNMRAVRSTAPSSHAHMASTWVDLHVLAMIHTNLFFLFDFRTLTPG